MTLRLVIHGPGSAFERIREGVRFDTATESAPTVMAKGLGGGWISQHYLEDDGAPIQLPASPPGKPPYRIPTLAEITALPWNGHNVVSTFSGGGGSCLGYRMAGYRVLWASDIVPEARETYLANAPAGAVVDSRDIRDVQPADILTATGLRVGELDLFDGSPPCQSFSTAGKRERGWGRVAEYGDGTTQISDDLFFEYARLLEGLQPQVFVAENVAGLIRGTAKGYFKLILRRLRACGYRVQARLLDAQWLGVPQHRERLIFIGVRDDLGIDPAFPTPLRYRYSVRDAIDDLADGNVEPEAWLRGKVAHIVDRMRPGQSGEDVTGRGYFSLRRLSPDKPAGTVQASEATTASTNQVHPTERRRLTIAELKRLCGFPDDYRLVGSYAQQWARLGNSVPPLMMRPVAETVRDRIHARIGQTAKPAR